MKPLDSLTTLKFVDISTINNTPRVKVEENTSRMMSCLRSIMQKTKLSPLKINNNNVTTESIKKEHPAPVSKENCKMQNLMGMICDTQKSFGFDKGSFLKEMKTIDDNYSRNIKLKPMYF